MTVPTLARHATVPTPPGPFTVVVDADAEGRDVVIASGWTADVADLLPVVHTSLRPAGSEFQLKADLVLLAMGFLGPRKPGFVEQSGVALDPRGNVKANTVNYQTSNPKVFAAGDMRRGQSLVVWAIREGRQCARSVDTWLMGKTDLPR